MSKAREVLNQMKEAFMKPDVFKSKGLEIDTHAGTFYLPDDVIDSESLFKGRGLDGRRVAKVWDKIKDYIEVSSPSSVYGVVKINGWFGRLSAPGYMDSTDYTFGETEEKVRKELDRNYGEEE